MTADGKTTGSGRDGRGFLGRITPGGPPEEGGGRRTGEDVPLTQQVGRVAVALVAFLFGVFAVVNAQPVAFDWVFGETVPREDPTGGYAGGGVRLIVLLVGSFLAGSLVTWFSMWWRGRRSARRDRARE